MSEVTAALEQNTGGPKPLLVTTVLLFMFLALELKLDQKIGFEVKDDLHIDKDDGKSILPQ